MSISIFRKIPIYYAAVKDSKGAYGSYLIELYTGKENGAKFYLSEFMIRLVIRYSKKCERKLSHTGHFHRLYIKILRQCRVLDEYMKQHDGQIEILQDSIKEIDGKIQKSQKRLSGLKTAWRHTHETGNLPPDLDVSTVKELGTLIDGIEAEVRGLTAETESLRKKLQAMQNEPNMDALKESARLEKFMLSYQNKINRLHRYLTAFANRQDESLVYYWYKLCERLSKKSGRVIYDQSKSFQQICQLKGFKLKEKKELFADERAEINGRTRNYKNFSVKV